MPDVYPSTCNLPSAQFLWLGIRKTNVDMIVEIGHIVAFPNRKPLKSYSHKKIHIYTL